MFRKITVAYDGSPEAARALARSIQLAKALDAELCAITVQQDLPPIWPTRLPRAPLSRWLSSKTKRHTVSSCIPKPVIPLLREGVKLETHLLEGNVVDAIARFLLDNKTDLLVIGLHRHAAHISRLSSTVYGAALDAPCSVLGVH